jgi:hypothetical protein
MKDGGPAFAAGGGTENWSQSGMSLRDYFATAVLQAVIIADRGEAVKMARAKDMDGEDVMAGIAYGFADAMLAQREKP